MLFEIPNVLHKQKPLYLFQGGKWANALGTISYTNTAGDPNATINSSGILVLTRVSMGYNNPAKRITSANTINVSQYSKMGFSCSYYVNAANYWAYENIITENNTNTTFGGMRDSTSAFKNVFVDISALASLKLDFTMTIKNYNQGASTSSSIRIKEIWLE